MLSEEAQKVKKQLEELNQAKRKIKNLQAELEHWQKLEGVIKAQGATEKVDAIGTPYAERRAIKMDELMRMIEASIEVTLKMENEFLQDLAQLDSLSQNLLFERYLTGKSLKRIIREFNYSDRQIYRKYDVAFELMAKNNKDGTKCQ